MDQKSELPIGPYIPEDAIQDNSAFVKPTTTALGVFAAATSLSGSLSATQNAITAAKLADANEFPSGKYLTESEWKDSPYFRKGLSYPNGVNENFAKLAAEKLDRLNTDQDLLSSAQPGFVTGLSKTAGSIMGFAADPINALGGEAISSLVGAKLLTGMAGLTSTANVLTRIGSRAAVGSLEGSLAVAPSSLSAYATNNYMGMNTNFAQALEGIGMGAGLGGILRGVSGLKRPITDESFQLAKKTAVGQILSDKSVDIGDIISTGYHDQIAKDTPIDLDTFNKVKQNLNDNLSAADDSVNKQIESVNAFADEKPVVRQGHDTPTHLNHLKEILQKPRNDRTADEQKFLESNQDNAEIKNYQNISAKDPILRTEAEKEFLTKMDNGSERSMVASRLEQHNLNVKDINGQLKKVVFGDKHTRDRLNSQLDSEIHKSDMAGNRLNELDKTPAFSQRLKEEKVKLFNTRNQRNDLRNVANEHDIDFFSKPIVTNEKNVDDIKADLEPPSGSLPPVVTIKDLQATFDHINSYKGDLSYSPQDEVNLEAALEGTKEDLQDQMDVENDRIDDLKASKLLGEKDREVISSIEALSKKTGILRSALLKTVKCISGSK